MTNHRPNGLFKTSFLVRARSRKVTTLYCTLKHVGPQHRLQKHQRSRQQQLQFQPKHSSSHQREHQPNHPSSYQQGLREGQRASRLGPPHQISALPTTLRMEVQKSASPCLPTRLFQLAKCALRSLMATTTLSRLHTRPVVHVLA